MSTNVIHLSPKLLLVDAEERTDCSQEEAMDDITEHDAEEEGEGEEREQSRIHFLVCPKSYGDQ